MLPRAARGWVALAHRAFHAVTTAQPQPAAAAPLRPVLRRPLTTLGVDSRPAAAPTTAGLLPPNAGHPAAATAAAEQAQASVAAMLSTEPERQRQLARAAKRLERLQTALPADGTARRRARRSS